jgi:DNA-binding transcriptional ArsR family regulator
MELTTITPGPEALKAMAHPVRLRLIGLLRHDGPSTASALAARLGLNSGATSYHLRQLAKHGYVVDDESRGNGRERWWRAAHQTTRVTEGVEIQDDRDAIDAFAQAIAIVHTEQLQHAVEERPLLPLEWREPSSLSDWSKHLTPARALELSRAIDDLVTQFAEDEEDAEGAEDFIVTVHGFPRPGQVATGAADEGDPS